MLGPFATASRRHIAIHQVTHAACASMRIDDNDDNDNA